MREFDRELAPFIDDGLAFNFSNLERKNFTNRIIPPRFTDCGA